MSVYQTNPTRHTKRKLFFDGAVDSQRFDVVKYQHIETLNRTAIGMFWVPEELDLSKDAIDFKELSEAEKHIFTSNLLRQVMLDSIQGRGPALALLPICSLPELESFINTWNFFEGSIHSRSYTHIIRNIYPNPTAALDKMNEIEQIVTAADDISKYYDEVIGDYHHMAHWGDMTADYDQKANLWKLLVAINALEGIRFYASFACSWAFAENKLMVGNADIIRLICRDENLHLGFTQWLLKTLPKDDPDFEYIADTTREACAEIVESVLAQEKEWVTFLFSKGSILGLNEEILHSYLEWLTAKRMRAINLTPSFSVGKANPLPWTQKYISSDNVQVAPQEREITSYVVGGVDNDLNTDSLAEFADI